MSIETAKSRVQAGIKKLDDNTGTYGVVPNGWRTKIDVAKLNLASPTNCILGQIFGDYTEGYNKLNLSYGQPHSFGFEAEYRETTAEELKAAWSEALGLPEIDKIFVEYEGSVYAKRVKGFNVTEGGKQHVVYQYGVIKKGTWMPDEDMGAMSLAGFNKLVEWKPETLKHGVVLAENERGDTVTFIYGQDGSLWQPADKTRYATLEYRKSQGFTNFRNARVSSWDGNGEVLDTKWLNRQLSK